jgi:hypothetical protein
MRLKFTDLKLFTQQNFGAFALKIVSFPPKSSYELDFSTFVFKLTLAY